MKIIKACNAGFCFGVQRAVNSVYENLDQSCPLYTLGPIIHNPSVVDELKEKGVCVVEKIEDIPEGGTVVIRSHGVGRKVYDHITKKGLKMIDATCPYVRRIHHLVEKHYQKGYHIIIIGESQHPEVFGINGWCSGQAHIIYEVEDVEGLPQMEKACVVAQTTTTKQKWDELISKISSKADQIEEFNTICYATAERQKEAESIAKTVDIMWVIGGKNSSNTIKLYNICKSHCPNTFLIERAEDINVNVIDPQGTVGITAGASTPDWIIKEVIEKMNQIEEKNQEQINEMLNEEQDTNQEPEIIESSENPNDDQQETCEIPENDATEVASMEDFEETMVSLRAGQIVQGTVLSVSDSEVIVNIGYKSDGILPASEITLEDEITLKDALKPGDEIEVEILKVNDGEGNVMLSRKSAEKRGAWQEIEEGFASGKEFEGVCIEVVKGGVIAKIKGTRAFVPASQLSDHFVEDLNIFMGQPLRLKIIELEKSRRRVVASQRAILEIEAEQKRKQLWSSIEEGQRITGIVKRLTNFGAFVDIGGVDGLIHISDLSWGHVGHPKEVLTEEETVEVIVLAADEEKERISLGYKQTLPHPWDNVEQKYPEGSEIKGKVVRITSFGAFVELEPGVDGLVHISQVANRRIEKVEDELSIGQDVQAKVLNVNGEERRISLSIRDLMPKEEVQEVRRAKPTPAPVQQFEKEEMTVSLGEFFPDDLK